MGLDVVAEAAVLSGIAADGHQAVAAADAGDPELHVRRDVEVGALDMGISALAIAEDNGSFGEVAVFDGVKESVGVFASMPW